MARKACVETFDLFAIPAPAIKHARRKPVVRTAVKAATARGHAMAELAADRAGEAWKAAAYAAFLIHAKSHKQFITEDVRAEAKDLPRPTDPRAWGHVAMRAKRDGKIRAIGFRRAASSNGRPSTLWESI